MSERRVNFLVKGQNIVGNLHLPEGQKELPSCVVLSHGYKSYGSSPKYLKIGHRFSLKGIAVLRFDHRGALQGESEGKFEETTLTKRIEDLEAALDYLKNLPEVDPFRMGLLGSSLGGNTVLALAKDERIRAMVLLATPIDFSKLKPKAREILEKKRLYEDIKRYDFKQEVKKVSCPLLIIHGEQDELVPQNQAKILYEAAGSKIKKLKVIEKGNHSFTNKLNQVLSESLDWFKKYL